MVAGGTIKDKWQLNDLTRTKLNSPQSWRAGFSVSARRVFMQRPALALIFIPFTQLSLVIWAELFECSGTA